MIDAGLMDALAAALPFLLGAGIVQGFFVAAVLVSRKTGRSDAEVYIASLLVVFSVNIAYTTFFRAMLIRFTHQSPIGFEPLQLLFGPLVYLYVRQFVDTRRRFRLNDLLHFLPFVLLIMAAALHVVSGAGVSTRVTNATAKVLWGAVIVHLVCYVAVTFRIAARHDEAMRLEYSSMSKGSMKWINMFLLIFLAMSFLYFALLAWMIHGNVLPYFDYILGIALSLAVYGLGFFALTRAPAVLHNVADETTENVGDAGGKYGRGLAKGESERVLGRLLEFVVLKKSYLDPEITLPGISELSGIPRNQISQAVNEGLGKNFYDFINAYRVKEFQRLAALPQNAEVKILALAFEAGFNSKPTFNSVFKRATGFTPSEYRRQMVPIMSERTHKDYK